MRSLALVLGSLAVVAGWGHCSDLSTSCANWAKNGECTGDNALMVKKQCPHSCSLCSWVCRDLEPACSEWALQGQCEDNMEYMYSKCPTSCGVCKPKCMDKEEVLCPQWARAGECKTNPAIASTCPASCGICSSLCLDTANDCPQWAAAGHCNENPGYMLKTCPHSCNICDADKYGDKLCHDRNREQCLIWGDLECANNPASVLRECPSMCGLCTLACEDKHENCQQWVKGSDNKKTRESMKAACDTEFMWENCAQSCGVCEAIPAVKPPVKEEL